jgi:hypothetical protein
MSGELLAYRQQIIKKLGKEMHGHFKYSETETHSGFSCFYVEALLQYHTQSLQPKQVLRLLESEIMRQ